MNDEAPQKPERTLVFNLDGTIDPAQLEGLPQDFIDRVQSPEFIAQTKAAIRRQRGIEPTGRRESRRLVKLNPVPKAARGRKPYLINPKREHLEGLSGSAKKRMRRIARKVASATMQPRPA